MDARSLQVNLQLDSRPVLKLGGLAGLLLVPLTAFLLLAGDGQAVDREARVDQPAEIVVAWQSCREAVAGKLLQPDTAAFPDSPGELGRTVGRSSYRFEGTVESENDRGDRVRNRFVCRSQRSSGAWSSRILDLDYVGTASTAERQASSA